MMLAKLESLKRPALIVAALALAAGVVAGREKPAVELAAPAPRAVQSAALLADGELDLSVLERRGAAAPQADLFARRSFVPARARQAAAAAPAPSAPPLPFRYIGQLIEDGKLEIILLRGAEHLTIAEPGALDAQYRVDALSETSIAFTYLPLNTRQTLDIK
jgi:hypothetical protein